MRCCGRWGNSGSHNGCRSHGRCCATDGHTDRYRFCLKLFTISKCTIQVWSWRVVVANDTRWRAVSLEIWQLFYNVSKWGVRRWWRCSGCCWCCWCSNAIARDSRLWRWCSGQRCCRCGGVIVIVCFRFDGGCGALAVSGAGDRCCYQGRGWFHQLTACQIVIALKKIGSFVCVWLDATCAANNWICAQICLAVRILLCENIIVVIVVVVADAAAAAAVDDVILGNGRCSRRVCFKCDRGHFQWFAVAVTSSYRRYAAVVYRAGSVMVCCTVCTADTVHCGINGRRFGQYRCRRQSVTVKIVIVSDSAGGGGWGNGNRFTQCVIIVIRYQTLLITDYLVG